MVSIESFESNVRETNESENLYPHHLSPMRLGTPNCSSTQRDGAPSSIPVNIFSGVLRRSIRTLGLANFALKNERHAYSLQAK